MGKSELYLYALQPCVAPNTTVGEIPCHKSYIHRVYSLKREKKIHRVKKEERRISITLS